MNDTKKNERRLLNSVDPLLESMINHTNVTGIPFQITILVGGNMLTGVCVAEAEYFKAFAEGSIAALTQGLKFREEDTAISMDGNDSYSDNLEENKPSSLYLNLRDMKVIQPSMTYNQFPFRYWRIDVTHIQGWTFGTPD